MSLDGERYSASKYRTTLIEILSRSGTLVSMLIESPRTPLGKLGYVLVARHTVPQGWAFKHSELRAGISEPRLPTAIAPFTTLISTTLRNFPKLDFVNTCRSNQERSL
jgi:hypothetical protein